MPYRCDGSKLMHFKNGSWKLKQSCSSAENCKKAMKLLYGVESGGIKKEDIGKKKTNKKILKKIINKRK